MTFLGSLKDTLLFSICVGILGFLFMLIYEPFGLAELYAEFGVSGVLIYALLAVIVMILIFLTGIIFKRFRPGNKFSLKNYILFAVINMFTAGTVLFAAHEPLSQIPTEGWVDFFTIMRYSVLVLSLPYLLFGIYFTRKSTVSAEPPSLLHIRDEQNRTKLSIRTEEVVQFESNDNYVAVYLIEGDKKLIRTSLKKLETELPAGRFQRSSRSVIVNRLHITSVEKSGGQVKFYLEGVTEPLKVSRSLKDEFLKALES